LEFGFKDQGKIDKLSIRTRE